MSVGSATSTSSLVPFQLDPTPLPTPPSPADEQGTIVPPPPDTIALKRDSSAAAFASSHKQDKRFVEEDTHLLSEVMEKAFSQIPAAGNTLDLLARLMIEQASGHRQQALSDRLAARELAQAELLAQAGTLKDQASDLMKGAIVSLVVSIVTAAVTIAISAASVVASGASLSKAGDAAKAGTQAAELGKTAGGKLAKVTQDLSNAQASFRQSIAQSLSSASGAVNSLGQGAAGTASTIAQAEAKQDEAEGAIHAAKAQEIQSLGELRKGAEDALTETIRQLVEFLKDQGEAKAEVMRALSRIGG